MRPVLYATTLLISVVTGISAQAQAPATNQPSAWPDRPIRWIVPYPAGGGTDIVARAVADQLTLSLRQPVIVENRAGGNTIIGTTTVAQAAPDGHTIGLITDAFSANVALARQMPLRCAGEPAGVLFCVVDQFRQRAHRHELGVDDQYEGDLHQLGEGPQVAIGAPADRPPWTR